MKRAAAFLMLIVLAAVLTGCSLRPPDIQGRWSCVSEGQVVKVYITDEFITQQIGSTNNIWRYSLDRGSMTLLSPFTKHPLHVSCVMFGDLLVLDGLYLQRED